MRRLAGGVLCLALVAALSMGCGTSSPKDNQGTGINPCEGVVDGYPCRPYGEDVGDTVMNFTFYDPDTNEPLKMSDYITNAAEKRGSKVFIINSFAEWCSVCRRESPEIYQVYLDFRDRGAELLMTMNQDSEYTDNPDSIAAAATRWEEQVLTAAKGDDQFVGVLADKSKFLNAFYDISATPMNLLVGPGFNVYYKVTGWEGEEKFSKMLEAIIEEELE